MRTNARVDIGGKPVPVGSIFPRFRTRPASTCSPGSSCCRALISNITFGIKPLLALAEIPTFCKLFFFFLYKMKMKIQIHEKQDRVGVSFSFGSEHFGGSEQIPINCDLCSVETDR